MISTELISGLGLGQTCSQPLPAWRHMARLRAIAIRGRMRFRLLWLDRGLLGIFNLGPRWPDVEVCFGRPPDDVCSCHCRADCIDGGIRVVNPLDCPGGGDGVYSTCPHLLSAPKLAFVG